MRRVKYFLAVIVALVILGTLVVPTYAQAQDVVTAEVDRSNITTDDMLVLSVSVDSSAGDASQPVLPPLDGFAVLGSSRGTQMTIVNGNMSIKATYQYRLQPLQAGDFIIGPIGVSIDGNMYNTAPISVRVVQGTGVPQPANPPSSLFPSFPNFPSFPSLPSAPSAPSVPTVPVDPAAVPAELMGQDFFVEATVDNLTPYQGQQIVYTMRFYQAANGLGQTEYQPPTFTGFWSEDVPERGEYNTQAAGRNYRVTELKSILFPTVQGEVTIEPASLTIPGDFFSRGAVLNTKPVVLNVQPLPGDAPLSFQGGVGRYEIRAAVDTPQTKVNDTITWQVAIGGEGNIETLPDPQWPESSEWRAFDSQAKVDSRIENGIIVGSRTYDRVLVPTTAGDLALPSIEYSYFDPHTAEYMTINSEAIMVSVVPDGANTTAPTLPASNNNAASGLDAAATIGVDIRPIKAAPETWNLASKPVTQVTGFWLLWTVPLFLLVGHFSWQRWQMSRQNNVDSRRSQQAAKKAQQSLRQARKHPKNMHDAAGQILTTYLSEKLNQSVTGLTQISLAQLLQEKQVDPELVERVQNCLMVSEMGRYAPSEVSSESGDILSETKQVISELEKAL